MILHVEGKVVKIKNVGSNKILETLARISTGICEQPTDGKAAFSLPHVALTNCIGSQKWAGGHFR